MKKQSEIPPVNIGQLRAWFLGRGLNSIPGYWGIQPEEIEETLKTLKILREYDCILNGNHERKNFGIQICQAQKNDPEKLEWKELI